jgi:hypothetical protein
MDNFDNENTGYNSNSPNLENPEEPELSHSDKLTGVFSEPKVTFEKISRFPPRTMDWLLPICLFVIVAIVTLLLKMNDPEVKADFVKQQITEVQKGIDKAVADGKMSRSDADKRINETEKFFEGNGAIIIMLSQVFGTLVMAFIFFFFMALVYFLLARFALKENGTYISVLVASGLVSYIGIIQLIVSTILAVFMGRMILDTSLASLLNVSTSTYAGWALAKIDPFSIWSLFVLSIGLGKLFKAESLNKFYIMVFALWIVGSLIIFEISKLFASMF